jgi:hypothetical protein
MNVDRVLTAHYRKKADQFFEGMSLLSQGMETYGAGAALLAVHSAISLNDAILAASGQRAKADDHRVAIEMLKKLCARHGIEQAGIPHFQWLIARKTDIAYGANRISEKELQLSIAKAQRFATWAYVQFKEVLRVEET